MVSAGRGGEARIRELRRPGAQAQSWWTTAWAAARRASRRRPRGATRRPRWRCASTASGARPAAGRTPMLGAILRGLALADSRGTCCERAPRSQPHAHLQYCPLGSRASRHPRHLLRARPTHPTPLPAGGGLQKPRVPARHRGPPSELRVWQRVRLCCRDLPAGAPPLGAVVDQPRTRVACHARTTALHSHYLPQTATPACWPARTPGEAWGAAGRQGSSVGRS